MRIKLSGLVDIRLAFRKLEADMDDLIAQWCRDELGIKRQRARIRGRKRKP